MKWWAGESYLDGLGVELKTLFLIDQEFLNIFTLVTLELDHLAHLGVVDNGAIAGCKEICQQGCLVRGRR